MKQQMNKIWKRLLGLCVAAALLIPMSGPAFANEEPQLQISITTVQQLLELAKNCSKDEYSQGLVVSLDADLDLTGLEFATIPSFSGTFLGNGHTISGLYVAQEGSVQGLFRYLTATAQVQDLNLRGAVLPQGSRSHVGALAGSNSGVVTNCHFKGQVDGGQMVGGLVGTNRVSGILQDCTVEGKVQGDHFVGGIAGENLGTIRTCNSSARVNTEEPDNAIPLDELNRTTVFSTESPTTVTDLGGIAGTSSGVIRDCRNFGTVGYPHVGYNVGGIAGSQKGYITGCENNGSVQGRKEIGGIVGQMEPVTRVQYRADTLQILHSQLRNTSNLAERASANARNNAQSIHDQMGQLHGSADDAAEAVQQLLPQKGEGLLPHDQDRVLAAQNALSGSVSDMQSTMGGIASTAQQGAQSMSDDMQAMIDQVRAISHTLSTAEDHVGVSVKDVSDQDTEQDQTGKIADCENGASVEGDRNVGGVVGTIAWENDLDHEEDVQFSGNRSANINGEVRAVLLRCGNHGEIKGKKRNIGGVAGRASLGLIKDCGNTGAVLAQSADHVGGIAGLSAGTLRQNAAQCILEGDRCVGGIAGSASFAASCRSIVDIRQGTEQIGAVLGTFDGDILQPENALQQNMYLDIPGTPGGVDGISYHNAAQALSLEEFQALKDLQPVFDSATVTFVDQDNVIGHFTLPLGGTLSEQDVPQIPHRAGSWAYWKDLDKVQNDGVYLNTVVQAEHVQERTVIASTNTRKDERPILLAQGQFDAEDNMTLQPLKELPIVPEGDTVLEGWLLPKFESGQSVQMRYACPKEEQQQRMQVMLRTEDGSWTVAKTKIDGSYLVFSANQGTQAVCLVRKANMRMVLIVLLSLAAASLAVGLMVAVRRRARKKKVQTV